MMVKKLLQPTRNLVFAALAMTFVAEAAMALPPLPPNARRGGQTEDPAIPTRFIDTTARLFFENGTKHDFGEIWEHEKVSRVFEFESVGDSPVEITDVKTSCGCTVAATRNSAGEEQDVFQPGEKGYLEVTFDPKRRPGSQFKRVGITFNNEPRPRVNLTIMANVKSLIKHEPEVVFFRSVGKFESPRPEIPFSIVGRTAGFDADLVENPSPESFIIEKVGIEPLELEDGTEGGKVNFTVKVAEGARSGRIAFNMVFETNDERMAIYNMPISAVVKPDVVSLPERITLGRVSSGEPVSTTFTVTSATLRDFDIKNVSLSGPLRGASWTVEPVEPGQRDAYRVTVEKSNVNTQQRVFGQVTVVTDLPDEPLVQVAYSAWTTRAARPGSGAERMGGPGSGPEKENWRERNNVGPRQTGGGG